MRHRLGRMLSRSGHATTQPKQVRVPAAGRRQGLDLPRPRPIPIAQRAAPSACSVWGTSRPSCSSCGRPRSWQPTAASTPGPLRSPCSSMPPQCGQRGRHLPGRSARAALGSSSRRAWTAGRRPPGRSLRPRTPQAGAPQPNDPVRQRPDALISRRPQTTTRRASQARQRKQRARRAYQCCGHRSGVRCDASALHRRTAPLVITVVTFSRQ